MKIKSVKACWVHIPIPLERQHTSDFGRTLSFDGTLVRIGDVAEVKAIKRYEITITFANPVPAEAFKTLDGVADVETLDHGHAVRLAMQGSADAVIKAAANYSVVSLTSYEPSLEDIFLRYYESDVAPLKEVQSVAK